MNNIKHVVIDTLIALAIFLIPQVVLSGLLLFFENSITFDNYGFIVGLSLTLSSLFVILIVLLTRHISIKKEFNTKSIRWRLAPKILLAIFAGFFSLNVIAEFIGFQDVSFGIINILMKDKFGIFAVAFLGPVAEELVFRSALLGKMLKRGVNPIYAILISSFMFAVVHFNPIQIFYAFGVGVMFGVLYVKSKSVLPSCICHVLNNTLTVITFMINGDLANMTYKEIFGSCGILILITIIAIYLCVKIFLWYYRQNREESESLQINNDI